MKKVFKAVSHRISKLSANRRIFDDKAGYYNQALAKAGYNDQIQFIDPGNNIDHRPASHFNMINSHTHSHRLTRKQFTVNKTQKNTHWRKTVSL